MAKKIILIALAVLIAAIAVFAYANRSVIKSILSAIEYSGENLEEVRQSNEKALEEAAEKLVEAPLVTLSDEQIGALKKGELSEDEAVEIILGNLPKPSENKKPEPQKPAPQKPAQEAPNASPSPKPEQTEKDFVNDDVILEKQRRIAELVAKLYVMKESYIGKVDDLMYKAHDEYIALPEEKHTSANLISVATQYIGQAYSLEDECDGEVEKITDEMRKLLKETGGDPSLADVVLKTYENEKAIKKAYYLGLYKDKIS